jgi:bifunctional DNA-binding transcriptional regulator/antitoxin component of YhaV-PrlF toxin-antitoxin module
MDKDDLIVDREEVDRTGEVEMNKIQEQRRIVIPDGFMATLEMEVGDKVVVKCQDNSIKITKAEDVL